MSTADPDAPTPPGQRNRMIFYVLSIYLIGNLVYRIGLPAHEYPGQTATYLEMLVDALCAGALVGYRKYGPPALLWMGVIAGLGLFAIRLNSEASFWTGHLVYYVK